MKITFALKIEATITPKKKKSPARPKPQQSNSKTNIIITTK